MTQVGHTLVGAAMGAACWPDGIAAKWGVVHYLAFMLLANVPDLPLRNWGHDRYEVSHSVFVNLLFIGIALTLFACLRSVRIKVGGWNVVVAGALAWLSHLLLDSFYGQGSGVAIFWPFSTARLALPIPWFSTVHLSSCLTAQAFRAYTIEFASYAPLLLLAFAVRQSRVLKVNLE